MNLDAIFKAYDVRGTYPDELDEEASQRIGAAFACFVGSGEIIVGRDMRLSSEPLAEAFVAGAMSVGTDVVDIGLCSTDMVYFASGRLDRPGAMFTASHNPPQYNGIKFCRAGAAPVGRETGLDEIKRLAAGASPPARQRGGRRHLDVLDAFVDHLLALVPPESIGPLAVVVDAANGMAGKVVPAIFERLRARLVPLYFELDGTFPNHPADPIQPENLRDLQSAVLKEGADLGLAFDGDADRVFLVDERAQGVSGSLTTALVARRILEQEPGATIIYNAICSRVVPEIIAEGGGKGIRSRVGHSFIKQLMAETGAAFAGEHSGHYYFRDNYRADSGLLASLYVMQTMTAEGKPLSELLEALRRYAASGEINIRVADQQAVLERIAERFSDGQVDRLDGLTVSYRDWWFNVRPSNTEPLLRLNVEATDEALMHRKTEELLKLMKEA